MGTPGKRLTMGLGKKKFVIAFDETDAAAPLLPSAPGQKRMVQGLLIAREGDPEVKNVPQEHHVGRPVLQGGQHLEKDIGVPPRRADMRIRYQHQGLPMIVLRRLGAMEWCVHLIGPKIQGSWICLLRPQDLLCFHPHHVDDAEGTRQQYAQYP
mgnify:FL=1